MKKFTLCLTHQCNLRCTYCYVDKRAGRMPIGVAEKIVDFIFDHATDEENIDIGFFGGEPLLEFKLLKKIVEMIERHRKFDRQRVSLSTVTNGTLFSNEIADYFAEHDIVLCFSCDGPPEVQDQFRHYRNGCGSSTSVLEAISKALARLPLVMVNSVYNPETLDVLPKTVEFLSSLGVRQIYLNPDVTACWRSEDADKLPDVYDRIGRLYIETQLKNDPHFISLIDSKITVILRSGYQSAERCQMGKRELAFSAEGAVYPCERLIGDGKGGPHCIGNILDGFSPGTTKTFCTNSGARRETPCSTCGIKEYCMNWCGCTNYLSTGHYDHMSPFLCASERAAVATAGKVYQHLESLRPGIFSDHLAGLPAMASRTNLRKEAARPNLEFHNL